MKHLRTDIQQRFFGIDDVRIHDDTNANETWYPKNVGIHIT